MKTEEATIDYKKMEKTFRLFVREKAIKAGSNIIYKENGQLIKENPGTLEKIVLKAFEPISSPS